MQENLQSCKNLSKNVIIRSSHRLDENDEDAIDEESINETIKNTFYNKFIGKLTKEKEEND